MKTKYQLLKDNENTIFQFIKNGIMSYQVIRDMEIYNAFIALEAKGNLKNTDLRYALLGDEYELSAKRIQQIINSMQNEIKE